MERASISAELAPILERLGIRSEAFGETVEHFPEKFGCIVGRESEIRQRAEELGRKTMHEVAAAREVFREGEEVDGVDG